MLFKDYVVHIKQLLENHPESANMTIITSSDDEGNCYNPVVYSPGIGHYEDHEFNNESSEKNNAVCLN